MNNKAHLRPDDYDSNGDIIPMSIKETTLNEAIKTIRELCKAKKDCTECPMNWNCGEDPAFWEEVKGNNEI